MGFYGCVVGGGILGLAPPAPSSFEGFRLWSKLAEKMPRDGFLAIMSGLALSPVCRLLRFALCAIVF